MRRPAALFVAAFATVAGGGLAVAVEGSPEAPDHDVPAGPPFADMEWVGDLPPGPPPHAASVQADDATTTATTATTTEDTVIEVEVAEQQPVDDTDGEAEAGPPADTHGAAVSQAAHECPHDDPEQTHGHCVSEVAGDNAGHADDDQAEETEDPEETEGEGRGHENSNGRGHERGRGNGHADD